MRVLRRSLPMEVFISGLTGETHMNDTRIYTPMCDRVAAFSLNQIGIL